jgi:hypothetical protein
MNIKDCEANSIQRMHLENMCTLLGTPFHSCYFFFFVAGKQAAYNGLTEYYQSLVCKANKSVDEEIARLLVAVFPDKCFVNSFLVFSRIHCILIGNLLLNPNSL